jgi:hypothetical protein
VHDAHDPSRQRFRRWTQAGGGIGRRRHDHAPSRATCKLAAALIASGYPADLPVRVVRANPWLFGPPHHVSGVSLRTVADFDFFADEEGLRDAATDIPLPRGSNSAVR